jgi:hypothetical protein
MPSDIGIRGITGQGLIDLVDDRLAGYQNAASPKKKIGFINEAKDAVWAILKNLEQDYFGQTSQGSDATQANYFAALATNTRSYSLPVDFHELRFVECTTSGFEQTKFEYREISHPTFQDARKTSNVDRTLFPFTTYYYTIFGKDQFIMAQFPEANFALTLYYVRWIQDIDTGDDLNEVMLPYSKKLADYAAKKISLSLQDPTQWEAWQKEWKDDILEINNSAGLRMSGDPQYAQDFLG